MTNAAGETVKHEVEDTEFNDDAEKAPLKPVSEERASIPRAKESTRTGRAALGKGAKQPTDHQTGKAALAAQRREAKDEDVLVTCTYNGVDFVFDPDMFDFEFQLTCEQGRPLIALARVLGQDQLKETFGWPAKDIQAFMNALTEAAGLGNS